MGLFSPVFSPENSDYIVVPFSEFFEKFNDLHTSKPRPAENPLCYYAQFFRSGIVAQPIAQPYYAGVDNKSCYVLLAVNPDNKCQQTLLGFAFLTFGTMESGMPFVNINHIEFVYDAFMQAPVLYALFLKGLFATISRLHYITGLVYPDYLYILDSLGAAYTSSNSFGLTRTNLLLHIGSLNLNIDWTSAYVVFQRAFTSLLPYNY